MPECIVSFHRGISLIRLPFCRSFFLSICCLSVCFHPCWPISNAIVDISSTYAFTYSLSLPFPRLSFFSFSLSSAPSSWSSSAPDRHHHHHDHHRRRRRRRRHHSFFTPDEGYYKYDSTGNVMLPFVKADTFFQWQDPDKVFAGNFRVSTTTPSPSSSSASSSSSSSQARVFDLSLPRNQIWMRKFCDRLRNDPMVLKVGGGEGEGKEGGKAVVVREIGCGGGEGAFEWKEEITRP